MTRRGQLLFLAAGTALFALLLDRLGLANLLADLRRTGWMLAPILAVYAGVYAFNALACWLVMAGLPGRPGYGPPLADKVSGFALNSVTPIAQVGGEPYKVGAFAPWLGVPRATGVVLTYYMLSALSNMLTWLAAIAIVLLALRPAAPLALGLALLGAALVLLVLFLLSRHRAGVFGLALRLIGRVPLVRRLGGRLERHRGTLMQIDEQIAGFYGRAPGRFWLALAVDFTGRTIGMLEYYLIARSVGLPIGFAQAFLMGSFLALGLNLLFFVPFDLGSREGGMLLIYQLLGLPPGLGVYAGIVTRLRWAAWIAIGLAVMGLGTTRGPAPAREGEEAMEATR